MSKDMMSVRQREILSQWKEADFLDRFCLVGFTCGLMGFGILYLYILEAIENHK